MMIKERWITDIHTLILQGLEPGPKLPYTEATLSYTDDQGQSLFKYPRDIMLVSEMLLMG
jgi:hypothetical protein